MIEETWIRVSPFFTIISKMWELRYAGVTRPAFGASSSLKQFVEWPEKQQNLYDVKQRNDLQSTKMTELTEWTLWHVSTVFCSLCRTGACWKSGPHHLYRQREQKRSPYSGGWR